MFFNSSIGQVNYTTWGREKTLSIFVIAGFSPVWDRMSDFCVVLHGGVFSGRAWGGQGEMNNKMWRYMLMWARYGTLPGRCRDEVFRSVAIRRHTLRTGVVSGSANLEKTGSFAVKIKNNWPVFQCTVNWSRARLS